MSTTAESLTQQDATSESVAPTDPAEAVIQRHADAMLRGALWPSVVVAVLALVAAYVLVGTPGVVGAGVGAVLVGGFSWLNLAILRRTAHWPAMLAFAAVTVGYFGKFVALLLLLVLLPRIPGLISVLDAQALGFTVLAIVGAWTIGEIVGFVRARVATVSPTGVGVSGGA